MSEEMPGQAPATAPRPPRSALRRWTVRVVRVLVIAYVVASIVLYLIQNWIIFPGAYFHGREAARLQSNARHQITLLRAADGHQVSVLFGAALMPEGSPREDADRCPTILYFYGNGDCLKTSLGIIDAFRRLGANVLCPEYEGYPISGGKPASRGFMLPQTPPGRICKPGPRWTGIKS